MATKAELEAEVEALKQQVSTIQHTEIEAAQAEYNAMRDRAIAAEAAAAELQAIVKALKAPAPRTTTVFERDGTPNVQNWVLDAQGNKHHYSP